MGSGNALVKPLLKKLGQELVLPSFRPVSNLPFISKLTEKASVNQLSGHMNKVWPLPSGQSTYRPFHSTETALLKVQPDILLNMDDQKVNRLVMLDLSAAFDTIDHSTLLETLGLCFGIGGTALKWFTSYLSQRTQQVQIKGTLPEKKQLECHRDPVLALCCSPSMLPTFSRSQKSTSRKPRAMLMTIKFTCHSDPFLPRIKLSQSLLLKIVWQNRGAGWFPTC